VQLFDDALTLFFVEMDDRFRIAVRAVAMPSGFEPGPQISLGCVAQPCALLNAASYFSSGDFTLAPIQRWLCEPSLDGQ
jgi:hypothetical protein